MKLLITGGRGLVGSALIPLLKQQFAIDAPTREQFDLLRPDQVAAYIKKSRPEVILHAGAYVNAGEAEKERGDQTGVCYRTNVLGTRAVVETGVPTIYISTGSVFHGTDSNPGPFEIDDQPADQQSNGWYGYTKYLGELVNPYAIVRISHPVIPNGNDYLHKIINLYDKGKLFPLFPDQYFPLTHLTDLSNGINLIITKKLKGIFHIASPDMVSPYELTKYILPDSQVQKLSIDEFYRQGNSPLRFAKYSALSSEKTAKILRFSFHSWRL